MSGENTSAFAPTRWTLALRARGDSAESRAALSELSEAYYAPVLAFIRRVEPDPETPRDLTQAFFADLLSQQRVGAVEHFLAESRRKAAAARRGGGRRPVSIDAGVGTDTASEWQIPDPTAALPDSLFDRHWASALVDRAVGVLAGESQVAGRGEFAKRLKLS
jgi:RNA polymerase sigma-70 factor (ECF subfamily)